MLELPLLDEGRRQLDICNACRYCEGLCAVFPALERRSFFEEGDITYLASLCHDCRSCYEVCPYAPPHELAVDIPRLMTQVREKTYTHYAWPRTWAGLGRRGIRPLLVGAILVLATTLVFVGADQLVSAESGPGSFYRIIPWLAMVIPAMALSLFGITVMLQAGARFWRDTGTRAPIRATLRSVVAAAWDIATLRYLRGGGPGCDYPTERPSWSRRIYHTLVFYGFLSAFLASSIAALYQDVFGWDPPYPLLSAPVILGSVGGAAMIVGCLGLLDLKRRADAARSTDRMQAMDVSFIVALVLVNVSGFLVLVLRETPAMGISLALHLGLTGALFLTLPYGKFVHAVFRSVSLLRQQVEAQTEETILAEEDRRRVSEQPRREVEA